MRRCECSASLTLRPGDPSSATLIDAKWESIALAPVGDSAFPNDYFLFTAVRTNTLRHRLMMLRRVDAG